MELGALRLHCEGARRALQRQLARDGEPALRLEETQLYQLEDEVQCSRRVVIATPGLFHVVASFKGAGGSAATSDAAAEEARRGGDSDGATDGSDGSGPSLVSALSWKPVPDHLVTESRPNSPSPSSAKSRSKRRWLSSRLRQLRHRVETVRLTVQLTDVHDHELFVAHAATPPPAIESLVADFADQEGGFSFGAPGVVMLSEDNETLGSCSFFLHAGDVPAAVELKMVSNAKTLLTVHIYSAMLAQGEVKASIVADAAVTLAQRAGSGLAAAQKVEVAPALLLSENALSSPAGAGAGAAAAAAAAPAAPAAAATAAPAATVAKGDGDAAAQAAAADVPASAGGRLSGLGSFQQLEAAREILIIERQLSSEALGLEALGLEALESSSDEEENEEGASRPKAPLSAARSAHTILGASSDEEEGAVTRLEFESTAQIGLDAPGSASLSGLVGAEQGAHVGEGAEAAAPLLPLVQKGRHFYEYLGPDAPLGRSVLLRGVNLSGNVKLPARPDSRTHLRFDWGRLAEPEFAAQLSFVGRPFPLEEADEHLTRLSRWGFNCLRFLVNWEAIEHAGPGQYDVEYLDFVEQVIRRAGQYGFYVFVDPHQDVWSRPTGGSGAPAWTLTTAGLNLATLERAEACFTHNSSEAPAKFQRMSWPQNYQRFAAMHMFTLFWGGNDFAPELAVEGGIPVQEYLQRHFINAILQVALRVRDMPHVIGFDSFNEPSPGFIGHKLDEVMQPVIPPGPVFRPFDSMVAAAGVPRVVRRANGIGLLTGRHKANPEGVSAWLPGFPDVWRMHGVWDLVERRDEDTGRVLREPVLLRPNYFCEFPRSPGQAKVRFFKDYLRPFMVLYISKIRQIMPRAILFAEGDAFGEKEFVWDGVDPRGIVNTTHWYDGFTLFMASYNPRFTIDTDNGRPVVGRNSVYKLHQKKLAQIANLPRDAAGASVEMPTLIGEFGLPYNLNNKEGFKTGDFSNHEKALTMYYDVFDALQLNSTQWNYCATNSNEWGDDWNLEDLSIFSRDQQTKPTHVDINSGGRAINGFCRPYAPRVCGKPRVTHFNHATKQFVHQYTPNGRNFSFGDERFCTEIFVPDGQYMSSKASVVAFAVSVDGGRFKHVQLPGRHVLLVWADPSTCTEATGVTVIVSLKNVSAHRELRSAPSNGMVSEADARRLSSSSPGGIAGRKSPATPNPQPDPGPRGRLAPASPGTPRVSSPSASRKAPASPPASPPALLPTRRFAAALADETGD